jgi:glycosyltransferase involved in cell wall biosynthesis
LNPNALISIVMPCYNCDVYVSEAVSSILNQSFKNFEFIIFNDGSTDKSEEEILKFKDDRIKYIHHETNIGNYRCRNLGLAISKGKYICVMDADDIALPDRLQLEYTFMEAHPKVGCVSGGCYLIDGDGNMIGQKTPPTNAAAIKVRLLQNNVLIHPAVMFRSSVLRNKGLLYDEQFVYASDYDLMCKLSMVTTVTNLNIPLIKYRIHAKQISSEKQQEQKYFADLIKLKILDLLNIYPNLKEKSLHLKLMSLTKLSETELVQAEAWLNRLLEANRVFKIFKLSELYNLFKFLLLVSLGKA